MGRGKLKLELIGNEKARKTTFHKRKKGIMKKAYEFSVLCGVDVCLLVSGDAVETWPPERDAALRIVEKYRLAVSRNCQKKSYSLADVVAERKRKVDDQISRHGKRTAAAESDHLRGLSAAELAEFARKLDGKIDSVRLAIEATGKNEGESLLALPESNRWTRIEHFNAVDTTGTAAAMVGGPCPCYGMQYFCTLPPPFQMQYQTMSTSLVPRIGVNEISPVIRMACQGNTELCCVVNSFMKMG